MVRVMSTEKLNYKLDSRSLFSTIIGKSFNLKLPVASRASSGSRGLHYFWALLLVPQDEVSAASVFFLSGVTWIQMLLVKVTRGKRYAGLLRIDEQSVLQNKVKVRVGGKLPKAKPKPNGLDVIIRALTSPRFIVFNLVLFQLNSLVLRNEKSLEAFSATL